MMRRHSKLLEACDSYGRAPGVDGAQYDPRRSDLTAAIPTPDLQSVRQAIRTGILTRSVAGEVRRLSPSRLQEI